MQVAFTLEGPNGLRFEGRTTGLNEHGLGGRVNLVAGELPSTPAGTEVKIRIEIPDEGDFESPSGSILRLEPSWVPGFQYFVTIKYTLVNPDVVSYLRRYIEWREDEYFTATKPQRRWYLFSVGQNKQYGPLTSQEVRNAADAKGVAGEDLIWSPERAAWVRFDRVAFDALARANGDVEEEGDEKARGEPRSRLRRVWEDRHGRLILIATACSAVALLVFGAFGLYLAGGRDYIEALNLYREGVHFRKTGNFNLAINKFETLSRLYGSTTWSGWARPQLRFCRNALRLREERRWAEDRLRALDKLPEELKRHPFVLNNVGDCYFKLGDYSKAKEYFQRALEQQRDAGKTRFNLATTFLLLGDYAEAERQFALVNGRFGELPECHLNRGLAALGRGRRAEALQLFDQAVRLTPPESPLADRIEAAIAKAGSR